MSGCDGLTITLVETVVSDIFIQRRLFCVSLFAFPKAVRRVGKCIDLSSQIVWLRVEGVETVHWLASFWKCTWPQNSLGCYLNSAPTCRIVGPIVGSTQDRTATWWNPPALIAIRDAEATSSTNTLSQQVRTSSFESSLFSRSSVSALAASHIRLCPVLY